MKSLKIVIIFSLLLVVFFSFIKKEINSPEIKLNLEEINVIEILSKQKHQCRPSSDFLFYVETNLIKRSRGSNTINANIFVLDRVTGYSNLLATENILVPLYKGAISLEHTTLISNCEKAVLDNGDKIIGSAINAPYCFNELVQFESIYRSYIQSNKTLLNLKDI